MKRAIRTDDGSSSSALVSESMVACLRRHLGRIVMVVARDATTVRKEGRAWASRGQPLELELGAVDGDAPFEPFEPAGHPALPVPG